MTPPPAYEYVRYERRAPRIRRVSVLPKQNVKAANTNQKAHSAQLGHGVIANAKPGRSPRPTA